MQSSGEALQDGGLQPAHSHICPTHPKPAGPPVVPDEKMTPVTSSPSATWARSGGEGGTASRNRSQDKSCGRSSTCRGEMVQLQGQ